MHSERTENVADRWLCWWRWGRGCSSGRHSSRGSRSRSWGSLSRNTSWSLWCNLTYKADSTIQVTNSTWGSSDCTRSSRSRTCCLARNTSRSLWRDLTDESDSTIQVTGSYESASSCCFCSHWRSRNTSRSSWPVLANLSISTFAGASSLGSRLICNKKTIYYGRIRLAKVYR